MKTREKLSIIFNILIFVFTLFATISMIIGFKFMGQFEVLSERNFKSFRFFTVDSNVFAGLISLAYVIYKCTASGKKRETLPRAFYILKLAATTGVTYAIVGDLDQGALANFPNGEDIEFTFDNITLKKQDLIEVLGKQYVALGVVANNAFVKITH